MPKFKAKYIFDKMYEFEGEKEVEAKDINEAIEKLKKAGRRGHLIDETFEVDDKPIYSPKGMHVFNSEKFSDENEARESLDLDGNSPDVVIDEDFTFED